MAIPPHPNAPPPTPLTFPAATFAKLSPTTYLTAHLSTPTSARPSSRLPAQSRVPSCNTGSLTHAHGSAVVRCGDTAVVCGVRGEVLRVDDVADYGARKEGLEGGDGEDEGDGDEDEEAKSKRRKEDSGEMARLGLLVPNLELATGCSPAHLPGGPPSALAQTLTQRILTLLHTSQILSMSDLRIWSQPPPMTSQKEPETEEDLVAKPEIKAFWALYIDILFLSLSGNAFDAAWFSMIAALGNVKLPRAWWDGDAESVVCSPLVDEAKGLTLHDVPVALSFGVFHGDKEEKRGNKKGKGQQRRKWILADMDGFEEGLCEETATVVVGDKGRIVRIEKSGGGGVGIEEMRGLVELASERRKEWLGLIRRG